jgi:DMSO/TMAO reductase YedYZ molybdopterin-dependent catalytic subunit
MDTDTLHQQEEREQQEAQRRHDAGGPTPGRPAHRALGVLGRVGISLVAGLLGSLAAILIMGILRLTVGAPSLPELLGERILLTLDASTFVSLLVRFAPDSKTSPLGLTLLGQFLIGILLGPALYLAAGRPDGRSGRWPNRRAWVVAAGFVVVMEAVAIGLFWPVLDAGLVGDPPGRARVITSLCMLATFIGFVGVTLLADHWLSRAWLPRAGVGPAGSTAARAEGENADARRPQAAVGEAQRYEEAGGGANAISRREALGAAGVTILAVATAGVGIDRLIAGYLARSNLSYEGVPTRGLAPIIPADNFYVVSKNVLDPQVSLSRWELQVQGLVGRARSWSYEQVKALPSETRAVTLECIANGPGGHLMGNAEWTGVLLETVLDEAGGVQANGKYVTFTSVDGYQYNQSLANLMEARALLAWDMNGVPLPERHGYPLRLIMPGRYGEQSVKWLTNIEVVDQPYNGGLYQSQGWSSAPVETTSRIDQPGIRSKIPLGPVQMVGIAFAGIRGIQQVEVSTDNGQTWYTATLTPPLSGQSWVLWNWTWMPTVRGAYTLVVRATDGTGTLQTETPRSTVPNGGAGYQHLPVQIV